MKSESLLTGLAGLVLGIGATLLMMDRPDALPDAGSVLSHEQVNPIETRATELDERIRLATEKITDCDTQISALQQIIADLKTEDKSSRIVPEPETNDASGFSKRLDEHMGKMMNSEAGKAIMHAGIMQGIKVEYADLIATLELSDAQAEDFLGLIADRSLRSMQSTDPNMKINEDGMLDLSLDEDALTKIEQEESVLNNKIQVILGEQGYEDYKTYERTREDRQIVSALETAMGDSEQPLDAAQKEQLLAVMITERSGSMEMWDKMKAPSADFDWEKAKSEVTQYNARILEHAIGILYQEQYMMLEQLFKQQRSMMDMINMNVETGKSTIE